MAWIKSHQTLRAHRKLMRLARTLGISKPQAIGHLHYGWWWALDNALDGNLSGLDPADIADAFVWEGDPDAFFKAMVDSGFIDQDGDHLAIHDWDDYHGDLLDKREENKARQRRKRAKDRDKREGERDCHAPVTRDSHANVTPVTGLEKSREEKSREEYIKSPLPPQGESEEKPKRARVKKAEPPAWFSLLWENSPKKTGERDAIAAAHRIEKETPEKGEQIARAWSSYRAFIDAKDGGNYQYIVKAHTFLTEPWRWNAEHWEAELVKLNSKVAPFQRPEKSPYATTDDAIAGFLAKYGGVE